MPPRISAQIIMAAIAAGRLRFQTFAPAAANSAATPKTGRNVAARWPRMPHAQAMAMGLRSGPTSRSKRAMTWVVGMSDLAPLAFDSAEPDIRDTANAPDA